MSRILITGVAGMDGSLLADRLLKEGHTVYGLVRRSGSPNYWRLHSALEHPQFHLIEGDVTAQDSIHRAIEIASPEALFHLAAQSFVPYSWTAPLHTFKSTAVGTFNVLEAIRNVDRTIRFYQASSSEMFGKVREIPQKEETPFYPRSPYGVAKAAAHYATVNYRESFGIYAASGILFNHEHERRGLSFVTRKITQGTALFFLNYLCGRPTEPIKLGNLEAQRDWGYAEDYVKAMIKILAYPSPETFVIATGETRTVRAWCETTVQAAAKALNLPSSPIEWSGPPDQEIGRFEGKPLYVVDPEFFRPAEVDRLLGDASKARALLQWVPETPFEEMVSRMFQYDFAQLGKQKSELIFSS